MHLCTLSGKFTPVADLSPALSRKLDGAMNSGNLVGGVEAALASGEKKADAMVAEAVRRIVLARGASDLVRLAGELGVGIRQLARRFNTSVGLPPKLFGRMQRFMHVFRVIQEEPYTWVDAAIHCGYYDQAHLIRDFRNFSGETPAALLTGSADLARHFYSGSVLERFGVSHLSKTVEVGSV